MRALLARLQLCHKRGQITPDDELLVQSPLRQFKSMFPTTPLKKHSPLDILSAPPVPGHQRTFIVRDLGSVQSDWLAQEFVLAYFEGDGISPPVRLLSFRHLQIYAHAALQLKKSVVEKLQDFGR